MGNMVPNLTFNSGWLLGLCVSGRCAAGSLQPSSGRFCCSRVACRAEIIPGILQRRDFMEQNDFTEMEELKEKEKQEEQAKLETITKANRHDRRSGRGRS